MTFSRAQLIFMAAIILILGMAGLARAEKVCFKCHKQSLFQKKVIHEPLARGKCVACHKFVYAEVTLVGDTN